MNNVEPQSLREAKLRQRQLQSRAKKENASRRRKLKFAAAIIAVVLSVPAFWGAYAVYEWRSEVTAQNKAQLRQLLNKTDLFTDKDQELLVETVKALGHGSEYYALKKEYDDADNRYAANRISDKVYQKLLEWSR